MGYRLGSLVVAVLATVSASPAERSPEDAARERGAAILAPADSTDIAAYARRYGISPALARTIYHQARAVGVEPGLAFGLAATESRFNARAVGRSGERGLLQIKLATARGVDRRVRAEELFHPETNVRLGLLHLKREVEHFDHDWRLGLLAYNMGRARLERALERGHVPRTGYAARVLAHLSEQPL